MALIAILILIIFIILAIKQRERKVALKYGDSKVAEEVKRQKEKITKQYAEAEKLLDQEKLRNADTDTLIKYLEIKLEIKKNSDSIAREDIIRSLKFQDLRINNSICFVKLNFGKVNFWGHWYNCVYDYLVDSIYVLFEVAHSINTIFISGYKAFIDSKGAEENLCFISIKVNREQAYSLKRENLKPFEIVYNFDILQGFEINKKAEIIRVKPIYSHEDLEKMSYPTDQEEKEAVTVDIINNISAEQFEQLIALLLKKMNFIVEHTGKTGDGGIDIKAQNLSPITGGKYILQCKKYGADNKVDVKDVRDLFGVIHSEMANKGILITTSTFTNKAIEFSKGKPIELIDGEKLKKLLTQFLPKLSRKQQC